MKRRDFLKAAACGLAALGTQGCVSLPRSARRRPNILFCLSDDQTFLHAGAYGCRFVNTPAFDRVAREGVRFTHAFVSAPSCGPSRASVLTGLPFYRLREAAMNHTVWSAGLQTYPDLLAAAGYHVGFTGKGWGPGNWKAAGLKHNPVGVDYNGRKAQDAKVAGANDYLANFEDFLAARPAGAPFCFWYGGQDPHRPYQTGLGRRVGKKLEDAQVPPFLPDAPEVRGDLLDYAAGVERFDDYLGRLLHKLEDIGELDNTLVVVTSDNGMPFPRAKATLYDYGTRMPLAVRWGRQVKAGRLVDDFVSFTDLAPTFLEAAGLDGPPDLPGRSLLPVLRSGKSGQVDAARDAVVMGLERHLPGSRKDGSTYPIRALRTGEHLYVRNYAPDREPLGEAGGPVWPADDPTGGWGDCDGSPTKTYLWSHRAQYPELFNLAFGRRPAEELYDVRQDPCQMHNLAADGRYQDLKRQLSARLEQELSRTADPRAAGQGQFFDDVARRYGGLAL